MTLPRSVTLGFWVIVLIAATTRIVVIPRQSLWVDEIFSLAMATGHSLEQPVAESRPSLGDYVESPEPQLPEAYRAYLSNGPFVSFRSVTRALLLSDASPTPLLRASARLDATTRHLRLLAQAVFSRLFAGMPAHHIPDW